MSSPDDDGADKADPHAPAQFALSVRQPWAELILQSKKSIEIRTWSTDYRGSLWLHTGQKKDPELESHFGLSGLFYGGYIGRVTLSSVVRLDSARWQRWRSRHMVPGSLPDEGYGWLLRDPVRLPYPIPAQGQLRLFAPDSKNIGILEQAMMSGVAQHAVLGGDGG
jgi:hypothetical protein